MKRLAVGVATGLLLSWTAAAFAQGYDTRALRTIGQGRALFVQRCTACHGPLAHGLEGVPTGRDGITVSPPDLTRIGTRDGRFDRLHVRVHIEGQASGRCPDGMPCWQQVLRHGPGGDAVAMMQTHKLVRYLEWAQQQRAEARAEAAPVPQ